MFKNYFLILIVLNGFVFTKVYSKSNDILLLPSSEQSLKKKEEGLKCLIQATQLESKILNQSLISKNKNTLSIQNAYYFAVMAGISYLQKESAIPLYESLGFKKVKFFENINQGNDPTQWIVTDTQAYWVEDDTSIYLIYRGTDTENNGYDAFTNMAFFLQEFGTMGKVHTGFYAALTYFWKQLSAEFNALKTVKDLHVIGHSMGGALATLTAAKLLQRQTNKDSVFEMSLSDDPLLETKKYSSKVIIKGLTTFGSPKTGNEDFASIFDYLVFKAQTDPLKDGSEARGFYSTRFANKNDLVATVPSSFFGYEHISTLSYLTPEGDILVGEPALQRAPSLWDSDVKKWLKDHHMIRYAAQLGLYLKLPVEGCWNL